MREPVNVIPEAKRAPAALLPHMADTLTSYDVAAIAGLCRHAIYRHDDELQPTRDERGHRRYDRSRVERWCGERQARLEATRATRQAPRERRLGLIAARAVRRGTK